MLDRGSVCAMAMGALTTLTAQAPQEAWRTLPTAHYRIHYPPALADWAQEVGSRIEGIHGKVVELVGYASPETIQVLLADPRGEPNGMAFPLLSYPFVVLWRTEPRSDDLHGNALSGWTEELVSHELTHVHHLTRPKGLPTLLDHLFGLPVGPVALKCPRWAAEGYATLAEGRITGSGRPHSALRAAVIRQWARVGSLPPYEALDGSQGYLGGHMAYLVGSVYLEWLEAQRPGALQRFWKHLASWRNRSFDAAFLATFGFSPQEGYRRFQAEAAHDALEWEARFRVLGLREGQRVLAAGGTLRNLAVSPDGTRLLASLEAPGRSGLQVWPLQVKEARKLERPDPFNDAEEVPAERPVRMPLARLPALEHRVPQGAEWVDDHTIRFQLKHAAQDGSLHPRPALWHLPGGVDLAPGRLPPPRWRTLEPVHEKATWALLLDGQRIPLPGQAVGRAFLDEARGLVWAGCEVEGVINIVKVPFARTGDHLAFQEAEVMTRTVSAAWNPAPSPDGKTLYFTTLDPLGMDVRSLDLALPPLPPAPPQALLPEVRILAPRTVMPPQVEPVDLPRAALPLPTTPYRASANTWLQLSSGLSLTPSGESWQVGLAGSDLLRRCSWQVLAGMGDAAGPRGAMAGFASSAWAWQPSAALFSALERPSSQRFLPVAADRQRRGGELALTWEDRGDTPFWFSPVAAAERVDGLDAPGTATTRSLLGLRSGLTALWARGPWGMSAAPLLQGFTGLTTGGGTNRWTTLKAGLTLNLENPILPLRFSASGGRIGNTPKASAPEAFHLGGVTTSLVPQSLDCGRVEQPALPACLAIGNRFARWRIDAGGAFTAYVEGTALWNTGQDRGPYQRVAGVQVSLYNPLDPASDEALKRMRFQAGVHRPLDGPMRNRTVATLTLVIRP